jgi:hypothetical protein
MYQTGTLLAMVRAMQNDDEYLREAKEMLADSERSGADESLRGVRVFEKG